LEALTGIESIKLSALEPQILGRWRRLYADGLAVTRRRQLMEDRLDEVIGALQMGFAAGIVVYGAHGVLAGTIQLGVMVTATYIAASLLDPVCELASSVRSLQTVAVHLARIRDVLEEPPEPSAEDRAPVPVYGRVQLRRVSFRYPGAQRPTIDKVSLKVPAGSFVAVVGASGSGKSTLARLLFGLVPPEAGTVLIDGRDLAVTPRAEIAGRCGAVAQEPAVFHGTILENILMARPEATRADAVLAARLAELHRDISAMPMGYETLLSERGMGLSGGQRQRLALARALVRRPRLLLLDEATSAVDAETERAIFANLRGLGCTLIVIAHRLSTVRDAHQIVVMDQGRIVERGTHHDLCAAGGRYAALTEHQHTRDEPVPA
jgi:ATP-binding cassette, subfamily B, bacterial